MNTLTKLAAVGAVSLLAFQPAFAQDASSAVTDAMSAVSEAVPSAELTAEAAVAGSYEGLLGSLSAGMATDLTAITDATTVNIVTVSSISAGADLAALDTALTAATDAQTKLRTDVGANASLSAKLSAAGYTPDKVLAVVTETDGTVTVYVDDRA